MVTVLCSAGAVSRAPWSADSIASMTDASRSAAITAGFRKLGRMNAPGLSPLAACRTAGCFAAVCQRYVDGLSESCVGGGLHQADQPRIESWGSGVVITPKDTATAVLTSAASASNTTS